jgi:hypothetical protein
MSSCLHAEVLCHILGYLLFRHAGVSVSRVRNPLSYELPLALSLFTPFD